MNVSPSQEFTPLMNAQPARVKLSDVASAAGVSRTTVHYALNTPEDESKLKPSTRARVLRVAHELGYRPDRRAVSLVQGKTGNIGFIYGWTWPAGRQAILVPPDPVYSDFVYAAEEKLTERGLTGMVIFAGPYRDPVEIVVQRGVDGLVLFGHLTEHARMTLSKSPFPVVLVNIYEQLGLPIVNPDDLQGGRIAAEHLYKLGHRRIAYLEPTVPAHESTLFRRRGILETAAKSGAEPPLLAKDVDALVTHLKTASPQARPTAVICSTGMIGFEFTQAVLQAHLDIPRDVSVMWFDDSDYAKACRPPMTVVRIDGMALGRKAVALLCDKVLRGRMAEATACHLLPVELIERGSTAPPS